MPVTPRPGWALYLRVSDEDRQSPERSFALQRDAIDRLLLRGSDLRLLHEYEDRLTGTHYDRTGFQAMLEDAHAGKFSHLAIYRVDRFGRDTAEGLRVAKELRELGVRIVPASNPGLDLTTPDGWMLFTILLGLGEHEVGVLRLRTTGGMRAKLESGVWTFRAPDGYLNVSRQINSGKTESWIEIDPERAPMIRRAWDLLLTGEYSLSQICETLHAEGQTRRNGRPWVWYVKGRRQDSAATLSRIFHNPFYAGWLVVDGFDIVWGEIQSQAGALVSEGEWHRAQQLLEEHNRRKLNTKHRYLCQALLSLDLGTGEPITMQCSTVPRENLDDISYYHVPKRRLGKAESQGVYVPTTVVDAAVVDLLSAIAVRPSDVPRLRELYAEEVQAAVENSLDRQAAALRRKIAELYEAEKQYARLYAAGDLSRSAYNDLALEVRADLARAQTSLNQVEHDSQDRIRDLDHAIQILSRLPDAWPHLDFREKRQALRLIFRRIHIDRKGAVQPTSQLRAPFAYLTQVITRVIDSGEAAPAASPLSIHSTSDSFGAPERT